MDHIRSLSRTEMEEALHEAQGRLHEILQSAGHILYRLDVGKGFDYLSPFAEQIIGLPLSELQGFSLGQLSALLHPDDRERLFADDGVLQRALNGGEGAMASYATDYRLRRGDGSYCWLRDRGTIRLDEGRRARYVVGCAWDITEQKRTLDDLHMREEQLHVLIEASHAGIIMVSQSGTITAANTRMAEMFGCDVADLVGSEYPEFLHPDQRSRGDHLMRQLIAGEIDHVTTERHYLRRDGSDFWGYLSGRRHEDATGTLISLVGHITDITELKRNEDERLKLEQQLLHAQKLESLGVLAGGIAHDFNNLLTAIVGNADIALMKLPPESPVLENLQRIEKAAVRATDLAKQMLAYSGRGKFVVESIDLNRLVEEMGHMLQVSISKKAVLRFNLSRPIPAMDADATQVRQVVMNLVINASEAIGDKSGVIAITTGCLECDRAYLNDLLLDDIAEGLYVFVEVADTGCGMDRATISKIFDPFFTTKFTGRGLGMAAVLGIVRGHKGALRVYSEPGKGSTFKVLFPAGELPAELFNGVEHRGEWSGCGHVLLVDDEETVRAIGSELLRELGFDVTTASDGREALERFLERPEWQFVFLDLTMPHLDGEQTFRELRKLDPAVRVIMCSGYNEQEVTQKFLGKGLAGFIQKPYKLSTLAEVIRGAGR